MGTRFCPYCRNHKNDEGFKPIFHFATRSKRLQCPSCQEMRKRPRTELEQLAELEGKARRNAISIATKRGIEERRKKQEEEKHGGCK